MRRLVLHFLNVGHGDCTFVKFPSGRLMMVDINNSKSLPREDEVALAEQDGRRIDLSKALSDDERRWEEYYQSLLVDPYDYYHDHFSGQHIFRYVQTHPDMDHMSGLHRFFWQERVPLLNFWDTSHSKDLGTDIAKGRYSDRTCLPARRPYGVGGARVEQAGESSGAVSGAGGLLSTDARCRLTNAG